MSFNLKVSGNGRNRSDREVKWFKDVNDRQIRMKNPAASRRVSIAI
jgi:hypothetical protein